MSTLVIPWTVACQAPLSMGFSGKKTRVCCHFLLLGNFPTLDVNLGLPHCGQMLYQLSYVGSTIWGTVKFFSTEVVPFYISISNRSQFLFFHMLISTLFSIYLTIAILMDIKWYLIIILICMALMSSDIVQLFMCLKTIYISSLKKYLILFSHFKIE